MPTCRTAPLALALGSLAALAAWPATPTAAAPAKPRPEVEKCVERGLEWLRRTQAPDGHWEAQGGQYPTTMTGLAGMCMLMEGSTLRAGKYSDNLVRAVKWLTARAQPNGLIGNPADPSERERYTYGHGFGLLFLASVYGEEEDMEQRKKLEGILTRAVEFCGNAQTNRGGWGYLSAKEGGNFDEGSTTITQLQAIRSAKNAGIVVKAEIITNATKYLRDCTTPRGGIIYSLSSGGASAGQERTPLTAAAIACAFSSGQYNDDYAKKWMKYCQENIPIAKGRLAHDEYQSYYYAQAIYTLGDDRYAELFPNAPASSRVTWSAYYDAMSEYLVAQQGAEGSWGSGYIGPVFSTCVNLTILQLDKGLLPIYHR